MNTPHLALLLPGGLGEVDSGIHIPRIFELVRRLSDRFSITAYSHSLPGRAPKTMSCGKATVRFLRTTAEDSAPWRGAAFLSALTRDHMEKPFDLIHGMWGLPFGLYAVLAGKTIGVPSIVSLLGGETANIPEIGYGHMRRQPERSLIRWTCRHADALTTLSRYQLRQLNHHGVVRDDCEVIPPGVDCSLFPYSQKRNATPPHHFLHIGDLNKVKHQETLLRAFSIVASHGDAVLRIVGRDHLDGTLQRLAGDLHLDEKVEFRGFVSHSDIPAQLAWADVLLHSSLHEGGGTAMVEAMASGVVVCGTAVGVLSDLQDDCCLAVPPGDHERLGTGILELMNDKTRLSTMRTAAHQWAYRNDISTVVEKFTELYRRLLSGDPAPVTHRVSREMAAPHVH